jgi:hypothetical protein
MAPKAKYLNGCDCGCPTYRTLEPRGVLSAVPHIGRTGVVQSEATIKFVQAMRSEVQQIQSEHNNLFMFNSNVFRPVSQ